MADQTLTGRIKIKDDGATKNIRIVIKGLDDLQTETKDTNKDFKELQKTQKKTGAGFGGLAKGIAAAATAFVGLRAGFGFVKSSLMLFADYEQEMLAVKAISGATEEEFTKLKETARNLGATTQFSATQAASGMKNLSRAGFNAKETIAAMPGLLDLAAAGEVDLATASKIVASNLRAFSLEAGQSGKVADLFAKTANSSNTSVESLGESLRNMSATAAGSNQTLETSLAMIAALGDKALDGGRAGFALNAMFSSLVKKQKDGYVQIGNTNVAIKDQYGNFRDILKIIKDVERATKSLTPVQKMSALTKIFDAQAMRGVNILMSTGSDKLEEYRGKLEKANGAAKDVADTMNSGVKGSMKRFNSAWEELKLTIGESIAPAFLDSLSELTEGLSDFTKEINNVIKNMDYINKTFGKHDSGFAGLFNRAAGTTTKETALTESTGFFDFMGRAIKANFAAQKRLYSRDDKKPDRKMRGGGEIQRDGVVAELHKGERVLTRDEAKGGGAPTIYINNTFSGNMNENAIVDKMVRKLELALGNM